MKISRYLILGAALAGCLSCVKTNPELGGNLVPTGNRYRVFSTEFPLEGVQMKMADSLSGYSSSRITIGAVRDDIFGLTERECALTLVPLYDTLDFGNVQAVKSFHLNAVFDTTSVTRPGDERILQNVYASRITPGVDMKKLIDANDVEGNLSHDGVSILKGSPVIDGKSNLDLDFTESFALDFINLAQGMVMSEQFDEYLEKFPGIYLRTDVPAGNGGRINTFKLALGYNTSQYYLQDNYGSLTVSSIFDEETGPVDTTFFFYYGALEYNSADSLVNISGTKPEYAFNLAKHSSRSMAGAASDKVYMEGGAGLKPVIEAKVLRQGARDAIVSTLLANGYTAEDAQKALINKASLIMPFDMPDDYTELDHYFPARVSPTCRIRTDSTSTFMGLSDASSSTENQGDINRSNLQYEPDITYHLQQLLNMDDDNEYLEKGNYDIWLLLMGLQETTTSNEGNSDYSEYLQYLAYQSYYNSMYGGGYGYGYGSSSSYYSNYYSYMMAAMYASGSTTTSTEYTLDQDLYYRATLCGPQSPTRQPYMKLSFSVPMN